MLSKEVIFTQKLDRMVPESAHLQRIEAGCIDDLVCVFFLKPDDTLNGPEGELFSDFKRLFSPLVALVADKAALF
jgi:hypothetical protein